MSVTITIEAPSADIARREMQELLGPSLIWLKGDESSARAVVEELDTAAAEGIEPFAPEAESVEETASEPEQPRRTRGRPRKTPQVIDGESTLVSETTTAAEPEQIDLEDVIAAKAGEPEVPAPGDDEEVVEQTGPNAETQPADPDKGWTHDDAKAVARQMYVRLGTLQQHELDERLHNNLQKFGVQRIKDLPAENIEAFVRGVESEVA